MKIEKVTVFSKKYFLLINQLLKSNEKKNQLTWIEETCCPWLRLQPNNNCNKSGFKIKYVANHFDYKIYSIT